MRIKWLLIAISTIAIVSLIFPITFVAADSLVTNMNSAQNSGQTWLEHIISISPEESHSWAGAYLKNGQTCYDLNGEPDAYLFAIENNGIVGHVIVGGANYGFPVFEAGESAPPQIPSAQLIQSTVEKSLGLVVNLNDIGKPIKLLYLGVDSLFVLHNINGNLIATNLIFGKSERYSNLKSYLAAPSEYLAHKLSVDNATSSNIGPLWPSHVEFTEMYYYRDDNNGQTQCGPCSGVSIGMHYRPSCPNLPSNYNMYNVLYNTMSAGLGFVLTGNYGPGWTQMASYNGYYFMSSTYQNVIPSDYSNIVIPDLNSGWPSGLACHHITGGHWRAIKGYDSSSTHFIICTDQAAQDSRQFLNWDALPDNFHDLVVIMH